MVDCPRERQAAVLAVLRGADRPLTLHELHERLPHVGMAAILRALDLLEARGLTRSTGERGCEFLAESACWGGPPLAPGDLARFEIAA